MTIKITARDIKTRVKDMVYRQMGEIRKADPYWRKERAAKMAATEAAAYLTDPRFEVSPKSATAIRYWINDLKSI